MWCLVLLSCFQDTRGESLFGEAIDVCRPGPVKYRALLIGINDYAHFKKLKTPVSDVHELAAVLRAKYGFSAIKILTDAEATIQAIEDHLACLVRSADPGDSVLVYFAGHGLEGDKGGYWVPQDAVHGVTTSYYNNELLLQFAEACVARHVLIISDACFAGSIFKGTGTVYADESVHIRELFQKKSRWVMSSGYLTTVDDLKTGEKHSPFAHFLLSALLANETPYITGQKLTLDITKDVVQASKSGQLPKVGAVNEYGHEGGSFVFWNTGAMSDGKPYPPPWEADPEDYLPHFLRNLAGHRVLVENGGDDAMRRLLEKLEMEVLWEPETRRRSKRTVISYCSEVPVQSIVALCDYLHLKGYTLKTHEDNPELARDDDCGREYEITIRN